MSSPANVTDSASRPEPLAVAQPGSRCSTMYCATRFFISALCVVAKVCSTYRRAPVNVPM